MGPTIPTSPEQFLIDTLFPMLRNDLVTVVEARCPTHGRPGASPSFTACLLCCIACEILSHLTAPTTAVGDIAKRREFYWKLGLLVDDPRYEAWGEVVHQGFRHGIAHTFLPKYTSDIACAAIWLNAATDTRVGCVDELSSEPTELRRTRAEHHLRFQNDVLFIVPQIFYLDVTAWLDDYEQRLRAADQLTVVALSRTFPDWWRDTTTFRNRLGSPQESTTSMELEQYPSLKVADYWTASDGTSTVSASLERKSNSWIVVVTTDGIEARYSFGTHEEAEDFQVNQKRELARRGIL